MIGAYSYDSCDLFLQKLYVLVQVRCWHILLLGELPLCC